MSFLAQGVNARFAHWRDATGSASVCNAVTAGCSFTLNQSSLLKARFSIPVTLTVQKDGSGTGSVQGVLSGTAPTTNTTKIQCGTINSTNLSAGTMGPDRLLLATVQQTPALSRFRRIPS
ncbi:hypothetical protein L0222_21115 [bacterium]|nr:hypothetical protein [bacterium]MCI0606973.1 hypothetical protein [bacterium]